MRLAAENYSYTVHYFIYLFIYRFIILYYNTIIIILYYNTIPRSLYHETLKTSPPPFFTLSWNPKTQKLDLHVMNQQQWP